MQSRKKMGISIALIFSGLAFALTLYDIFFSEDNIVHAHAAGTWFIGLFSLLAIILSIGMFRCKNIIPGVLNTICLITAAIFSVFLGLYWILICLLIAIIGCIMHKASMVH